MSNLPLPLSRFIGREPQVADLHRLLATHRLVTLTGPGGCGKTRLACHAAGAVNRFGNQVWLVELADVHTPALIAQAAAAALGLPEKPNQPLLDTLTAHLQAHPSLLILDNCEHLADDCARFTHALLRACPDLCILATSREPLHLAGEVVYPTPCLSVPDGQSLEPAERLMGYEAVRLFADRAQSVLSTFRVTDANASAIAQICRLLDGIPLAIELAAPRIKVLAVEQIAARLERSLGLLRGQDPLATPRHQTMWGALDWSFQLLPEPVRALWLRLAVFAGNFSLAALESICTGGGIAPAEVLDLLEQLVDRSLVTVLERHGEMYYRLLEPIRQYGLAKLEASGESEALHQRHRDWYLQWAEEAHPRLTGPDQATWLARIGLTYPNFAAALQWSSARGDARETLRLGMALYRFWWIRGRRSEGRQWLETGLAMQSEPDLLRMDAHEKAGILAKEMGDFAAATAHYEASLALRRAQGDEKGLVGPLINLGVIDMRLGNLEKAKALLQEGRNLARRYGEQRGTTSTAGNLGMICLQQGAYDEAQAWFEEVLGLFREKGNLAGVAAALTSLGLVATARGDLDGAEALHGESLALRRQVEARHDIAQSLCNLGEVACLRGDLERAEELYGEVKALVDALDNRVGAGFARHGLARVARLRGDFARAGTLLRESLQVWYALQDKVHLADCLDEMARVAVEQGWYGRGARLLGTVTQLREAQRIHLSPFERADHERCTTAARDRLGEAVFHVAFHEGRSLSLEAAVAYGLEERSTPDPQEKPCEPSHELTPRETEVVRLVAEGLTLNQIGRRLHLSPRTVQKHEENIRTKLGLPNRTSLAAWAVRHGLLGGSETA